MFIRLLGVSLLCLGLSACSSINAGADYDSMIDFSGYKTAAWEVETLIVAPGSDPVSSLTAKRVLTAVETQMTYRGFEIVDDPEEADVLMVVVVGARDKIRYERDPELYDPRVSWCGPRCSTARVHPHVYTQGTLSIDLFDGATGEPVLHGWATKPITNEDRRNPKESIEAVVAAVFREFPMPWAER